MENCYLLGAGFSKALCPGMPLLNDLSNRIRNALGYDIKRIVPNLLDADFEVLLSYLYNDYPWKKPAERHNEMALYHDILRIVRKELNLVERRYFELLTPGSMDIAHAKFFRYIVNSSATLLSLNYDTLIENIIAGYEERIGSGVLKPFANKFRSFTDLYQLPILDISYRWGGSFLSGGRIKTDGVHLIKLHGSTNWFINGELTDPNLLQYYAVKHFEINFDPVHVQGLLPVIIPPTFDKAKFYSANNFLRILWRQARKAIQRAKTLVIIGYSLPISDSYIRLLFKSFANRKLKLKIVNPSVTEESFRKATELYFSWIDVNNIQYFESLQDYTKHL